MTFKIRKGKHRSWPLRFSFWWDRTVFAWTVKFDESCRYDLQSPDQLDTNKLIGIGYLPGHHNDSVRFGWRYDVEKGLIEILSYCYLNGRRDIKHIDYVIIGRWYRLELMVTRRSYFLSVGIAVKDTFKTSGEVAVHHTHKKKLQYRLGTFFGGNRPVPHDMKVQIEKV